MQVYNTSVLNATIANTVCILYPRTTEVRIAVAWLVVISPPEVDYSFAILRSWQINTNHTMHCGYRLNDQYITKQFVALGNVIWAYMIPYVIDVIGIRQQEMHVAMKSKSLSTYCVCTASGLVKCTHIALPRFMIFLPSVTIKTLFQAFVHVYQSIVHIIQLHGNEHFVRQSSSEYHKTAADSADDDFRISLSEKFLRSYVVLCMFNIWPIVHWGPVILLCRNCRLSNQYWLLCIVTFHWTVGPIRVPDKVAPSIDRSIDRSDSGVWRAVQVRAWPTV